MSSHTNPFLTCFPPAPQTSRTASPSQRQGQKLATESHLGGGSRQDFEEAQQHWVREASTGGEAIRKGPIAGGGCHAVEEDIGCGYENWIWESDGNGT